MEKVMGISLIVATFLFIEWVFLITVGCISCIFNAQDAFYCGAFCMVAKLSFAVILGLSAFLGYKMLKKNG